MSPFVELLQLAPLQHNHCASMIVLGLCAMSGTSCH
jgi:hypothetical protein